MLARVRRPARRAEALRSYRGCQCLTRHASCKAQQLNHVFIDLETTRIAEHHSAYRAIEGTDLAFVYGSASVDCLQQQVEVFDIVSRRKNRTGFHGVFAVRPRGFRTSVRWKASARSIH